MGLTLTRRLRGRLLRRLLELLTRLLGRERRGLRLGVLGQVVRAPPGREARAQEAQGPARALGLLRLAGLVEAGEQAETKAPQQAAKEVLEDPQQQDLAVEVEGRRQQGLALVVMEAP